MGGRCDDPRVNPATAARTPEQQAPTSGGVARHLLLAGITGPVAYMGLVAGLGALVNGYDPIRDSMSELGAVDSPHGRVMNVGGFMGLGMAIVAFAAGYHLVLRGRRLAGVATGLLVLAGGFMVAVGFFPCDAGCVDVTATGRLHSLTSAPQAVALPAAAMVSGWVLRDDGRLGAGWQVLSFWTGLVALGIGPLVGADLLPTVAGLVQRAGMGLSLVWMVAVSVGLRRVSTHEPP